MKTKTAYRSKKPEPEIPQPDRPANPEHIQAQPEPAAAVTTLQPEQKSETPALERKTEAEKYAEEAVKADEAAQHLKR
jgi:hypothetical protein